MMFSAIVSFSVFFQMGGAYVLPANEPTCSRFSYVEQLLEKMIRTEIKVEEFQSELRKIEDTVQNTLKEMSEKFRDIEDVLEDTRNNTTNEMATAAHNPQTKEEQLTKLQSVAFHAHHVKDAVLDTTDEILVFDTAITNEGSGYDTSTGVFTAPVGGIYQFSVHICSENSKYSPVGLVLEGDVVAAAISHDNDNYSCSSFGAIVRVRLTGKVWVKCTVANSEYKLYESKHAMNTFGGVLLGK